MKLIKIGMKYVVYVVELSFKVTQESKFQWLQFQILYGNNIPTNYRMCKID